MFNFSTASQPLPRDLAPLFAQSLETIASPGDGWNGSERVAIANITRNGTHDQAGVRLPSAAADAATLIGDGQARTTEEWVRSTVLTIGDTRYAELVGIAAVTKAIDTITALLGHEALPMPEPRSGDSVPPKHDRTLKRRSAWVAMSGPPVPRFALSAAPGTQALVTQLIERFYLSKDDVRSDGPVRGLTREQVEIVALKVSHSNECFR